MKPLEGENQTKLRSYEKPKLTEYGHVEKLTQSGGGTRSDGVHTRRR